MKNVFPLVILLHTNKGVVGDLIFYVKNFNDVVNKLYMIRDQFYRIIDDKKNFKVYGKFRFRNKVYSFHGNKNSIKYHLAKQKSLLEFF